METEFAVVGWFTTTMGCDRDNSEDSEDIMEGYGGLYVPAKKMGTCWYGGQKRMVDFWRI